MGAVLVKGTVYHYDGREVTFSAGMGDRIKTERALRVSLGDDVAESMKEEYMARMAFEAVRRQGGIEANTSFDLWIETLAGIEIDEDPESQAPPAT